MVFTDVSRLKGSKIEPWRIAKNRKWLLKESLIDPIVRGDMKSINSKFYFLLDIMNVAGYLDINLLTNSIEGLRHNSPDHIKNNYNILKDKFPEMFKEGMWGK